MLHTTPQQYCWKVWRRLNKTCLDDDDDDDIYIFFKAYKELVAQSPSNASGNMLHTTPQQYCWKVWRRVNKTCLDDDDDDDDIYIASISNGTHCSLSLKRFQLCVS
ncbi:hypothetical protein ES332_D08G143900v1 [Gossypium tomentosum]|uniref:Uncharacterized protein n=1 Tax=Gossypium tomentosum TaxID=34277 RepID=A0A5D2JWV9_GOSTO|nr:hypothetical protein ES332_D08G143900v1 [Gossypium tomentosum]